VWHEKLANQNKLLISLLIIPCLLYYCTRNYVSIVIGLAYIVFVLCNAKIQEKKIMKMASEMDSSCLSAFNKKMAQAVPAFENTKMTFGYLVSDSAFQCVLLVKRRDNVVMLDNVLLLNYVYGNYDGTVLCMADIDEAASFSSSVVLPDIAVAFSLCNEKHQAVLRKEAIGKNKYLIMESFMYEKVYRQMCTCKQKQLIHITYELTKMKKEKVYQLRLSSEDTLLVPASNLSRLS
jgi:hypothetical protein